MFTLHIFSFVTKRVLLVLQKNYKIFMESWRFHKSLNLSSFCIAKTKKKIILYLRLVIFGVF